MKNKFFKPLIFIRFRKESEPIITYLKHLKWHVVTFDLNSHADSPVSFHTGSIGLVDFSEYDPQLDNLDRLKAFITASKIKWLALVPSALLEQLSIKSLLRNYFDDYHLFPLTQMQLSNMLEQAKIMSSACDHPDNLIFDRVLLGHSRLINDLKQAIKKASSVDCTVLITGETGTGKELVARALHEMSDLSGPFIAVNCGGIANSLIQAELFGYEKGAFTGANQQKKGFIEAADNGTLLLDEIGELAFEQQANLLRFLQEGTIQRVGSVDTVKVRVRVIAATNVDLERAMYRERFRADLFYRLNVLEIKIPPLRDRQQDIELLAYYFLNKFSAEHHKQFSGFSSDCLAMMKSYAWHGNIREMMNRIQRAVIMCDGEELQSDDLGIELTDTKPRTQRLKAIKEETERRAIIDALERDEGNVSKASNHLGISRAMLYRLMNKHGLGH
ncbi:MAG TPA: sigma-54-dependent Fis family transcriptional regulator [Methylophaga sp.]|jgi:DNA-binding NtrC family response regulator|uniref:sigma-54 dependent transcriptional regulator n=1 Tax=unclassified Methylophaga TaxID=2629249 RepID=UPI000C8CE014|nr:MULTISPECIES: sigma-54 dependent transcriptional regulator [unclassified Methylophaga]MAP25792.1 sigma-54-dependent Fis family transcriptional regulator [Methylophaga sp.]HAD31702.1 sigma-54-dependent Fis family transcriptional regulator [Methylophaga sp.]HBX60037.1 sigma-54-dependent Fis family transcriptional regulator [Methylophaga sp.]|tara:strand:+ start:1563 stop:2897 length:1335 start_codon:yes stop_codon:yes gene_type:complete